jgi:1,4-dihydroxy-2-naphthoate polyprenyltransferase
VTYFVQTGHFSLDALLAGIPIGLLAANILLVNNYRDVETDMVVAKRTLVVRFGRRVARAQFAGALVVAMAAPILFVSRGYGLAILLPCLLGPIAWQQSRRLARATTAAELIALLGDAGKLLALYAGLLSVGILTT